MQLTPAGSTCSIQIGVGLTDAAPVSTRGLYTVVEDLGFGTKQAAPAWVSHVIG